MMTLPGPKALSALAALAALGACAAAPPAVSAVQPASILHSSSPAHGTTVRGPVDQLRLRFAAPARLNEVTVTGSDGLQMPMMVSAAGEVVDYALPLPGLEPGAYTVAWRASVAGASHQGSIRFNVR